MSISNEGRQLISSKINSVKETRKELMSKRALLMQTFKRAEKNVQENNTKIEEINNLIAKLQGDIGDDTRRGN